jgi:16S rRNA C967 or C1407 C5-methylase (RsmB/RsmF family)
LSIKGADAFNAYYTNLFGARWPGLRECLIQPPHQATIQAPLLRQYHLDDASLLCAKTIDIKPGHNLLDMCAAPGGKTLVLATLMGSDNRLTANEYSTARRKRLKHVLATHLPPRLRTQVKVCGFNALRWPNQYAGLYDRVLLDAPCSSERHVFNSPPHLAKWSSSRVKRLAKHQKDMLLTALKLIKPGGVTLYATCALSTAENDGVIQKILKRKAETISIIPINGLPGETTRYGFHILPDICQGRGPIYMSKVLRRY